MLQVQFSLMKLMHLLVKEVKVVKMRLVDELRQNFSFKWTVYPAHQVLVLTKQKMMRVSGKLSWFWLQLTDLKIWTRPLEED